MTVLENVKLARHMRRKQGLFDAILRTHALTQEEREIEHDAMELLKIFNLDGGPTSWPQICRMDPSAGWRSREHWPHSPRCCCWMNPRRE